MADKTLRIPGVMTDGSTEVSLVLHDEGGGLYSLKTYSAAGGGAATIADGADITEGAVADASVAAGAVGTVSAKLRRMSADIGTLAISKTVANFINGEVQVTNTTPVSLFPTAGASTKNYLTDFSISNTGVNTALITFYDDTSGNVIWRAIAPAGGGNNKSFLVPIMSAANKPLYVGSDTASSTISISATGYTSA